LSADRCLSLLATARSGHLALSHGALPLVVPVTCAFCELGREQGYGALLVRAGLALWHSSRVRPGVVAFGTSGENEDGSCRWEVGVQGRAEVVRHLEGAGECLRDPPPLRLLADELTTVLRLKVERLEGWEYGGPLDPPCSFDRILT
jgi:hypothetical protein